jgi:hypothetical protein
MCNKEVCRCEGGRERRGEGKGRNIFLYNILFLLLHILWFVRCM